MLITSFVTSMSLSGERNREVEFSPAPRPEWKRGYRGAAEGDEYWQRPLRESTLAAKQCYILPNPRTKALVYLVTRLEIPPDDLAYKEAARSVVHDGDL